MYRKLIYLAQKMEAIRVLDAIKRGLLMCLPLLMMGIVSMIVTSIPIAAVQNWYTTSMLGEMFYHFFDSIYRVTYGFMSLYVSVCVAFTYGRHFAKKQTIVLATSIVASFVCVLVSLGYHQAGFEISNFNATGVFTSFLTTILCTKLFYTLYYGIEKLRHTDQYSQIENRIHTIYLLIIPLMLCIVAFYLCNEAIYQCFHVYSLNGLFALAMSTIFLNMGTNIGSGMLLIFVESVMWFLGIHGGSIMENVANTVFAPANTDATVIVSRTFLDTFGLIGGCGTSICLFIAMLIWEKRKEQRTVLKTAILPILFNVNEPLIYGVPILFNPILFLPLVVTPLVSILIAYGATLVGFIPVTTRAVEWTTPIFLSGYTATGSPHGIVVQLVIIVVGVLIYMPFVKLMSEADMQTLDMAALALEEQFKKHMDDEEVVMQVLKQHNSWSIAGEALVSLLQEDIRNENIVLYYQPQIDNSGKVYGAEALLRWKCGERQLFPPFVLHMAKEAKLQDELGLEIVHQVCRDIARMKKEEDFHLRISVNISCDQINNDRFISEVIDTAKHYEVTNELCIEITEELSVERLKRASQNISRLKEVGIYVSMDDFSMGSTSIKSLQENIFSHVKLDGSLVADMERNPRSKEIIASIVSLGEVLGFKVVAEYVDSPTKLAELQEIGCDYFQGYFYSPAIPLDEFMEYTQQATTKEQ